MLMAGLQLGTAAILWTNKIGSPLDSQLPWQLFSELIIHGLGLAVCGINPQKHSTTVKPSGTIHDVASLATILLVTMAGRFLKAAPLNRLETEHIQQWLMPILSAMFDTHRDDPEIGGVLVILAALVVGQPYTSFEQGTIRSCMSHTDVRTGTSSRESLHATYPQSLSPHAVVAVSSQTGLMCAEGCMLLMFFQNIKQLLLIKAICMLSVC